MGFDGLAVRVYWQIEERRALQGSQDPLKGVLRAELANPAQIRAPRRWLVNRRPAFATELSANPLWAVCGLLCLVFRGELQPRLQPAATDLMRSGRLGGGRTAGKPFAVRRDRRWLQSAALRWLRAKLAALARGAVP